MVIYIRPTSVAEPKLWNSGINFSVAGPKPCNLGVTISVMGPILWKSDIGFSVVGLTLWNLCFTNVYMLRGPSPGIFSLVNYVLLVFDWLRYLL